MQSVRKYGVDEYGNTWSDFAQIEPVGGEVCYNPRRESLNEPPTPSKGKRLDIKNGNWIQIDIPKEHTTEIINDKIIYRPKTQIERYISGLDLIPKGLKLSEDKKEIISKTLNEQFESGEITKEEYNNIMSEQRRQFYITESDGLFFAFQREEIEKQIWLDKVKEIKSKFPKK